MDGKEWQETSLVAKVDELFHQELKDCTSKQMDAGASPEQVSKLVAELIELER